MRVNLVVVGDPSWQLTHYGFGIWSRTDADIVALDRANEGFSHSVALWTFERRRPRFEPDVAGEAAGVAGDVAAAVTSGAASTMVEAQLHAIAATDSTSLLTELASRHPPLNSTGVPVGDGLRPIDAQF